MSLDRLTALRDHLLDLDSGSGDAATLTWAIDAIRILRCVIEDAPVLVIDRKIASARGETEALAYADLLQAWRRRSTSELSKLN